MSLNANDGRREALRLEAIRLAESGRTAEAIAVYERLLEAQPALPDCWFDLAILYRKVHRFEAAIDAYRRALEHGIARPEEVHVNCSVIYADYLQNPAQAVRELDSALAANPDFVPALMNRANLYEDYGQREQALNAYERILRIAPRSFEALARYANAKQVGDKNDPIIRRLRDAIGDSGVPSADRASLAFALGKALDACGEYGEAFAAYEKANQLSRRNAPHGFSPYDKRRQEQLTDEVMRAFEHGSTAAPSSTATRPIFICGMFRSGSSLVETLLGRHSRISTGGELYFLPKLVGTFLTPFPAAVTTVQADTFAELSRFYLEALSKTFPGTNHVTDKRLENFQYIGVIKRMFPGAKIIHTCRNPLDTCLSVYFLHAAHSVNYSFDLLDIGHYHVQHARLMQHWRSVYPDDIIEFDYDAFVQSPRASVERLLHALGLGFEAACLNPRESESAVKTASSWQVRQPIHTGSSGRWRHYAKQLEPLRQQYFHQEKGSGL